MTLLPYYTTPHYTTLHYTTRCSLHYTQPACVPLSPNTPPFSFTYYYRQQGSMQPLLVDVQLVIMNKSNKRLDLLLTLKRHPHDGYVWQGKVCGCGVHYLVFLFVGKEVYYGFGTWWYSNCKFYCKCICLWDAWLQFLYHIGRTW